MFRAKEILLTCSIILIVCLLFDAQSYAQSKEATNLARRKFQISFGGGWGLYSMRDINKDYIDELAKPGGIFGDHIDNGPNVCGEIGYFVSPTVSVGFGVTYLRGGIDEQSILEVIDYEDPNKTSSVPWERSLTTTMIALHPKIKYHLPGEDMDVFFGGGAAWCLGKCIIKSTIKPPEGPISEESHFSARGIGFLASTGASYHLNKTFSIGAEIGYRRFATGDLKDQEDKNGEEQKVGTYASEILRKTNLDFSGPFILGSLSIRL